MYVYSAEKIITNLTYISKKPNCEHRKQPFTSKAIALHHSVMTALAGRSLRVSGGCLSQKPGTGLGTRCTKAHVLNYNYSCFPNKLKKIPMGVAKRR